MILGILLALAFSQTPADLFNQGNQRFAQKDYPGAIEYYEQALKRTPGVRVYYNLGNAYFKANQIGRAIISYRRALTLAPRDPDVNFNLRFARNFRIDKILVPPSPLQETVADVLRFCSRPETSFLSAVFFLISSILISLFIITRHRLWLWSFLPGLVLFCLFFLSGQSWRAEINRNNAVIVQLEVNALSGPAEDYKDILVIHDGTEVKVRERRGDYYLIQLPEGMGGWVKSADFEIVFP
jgi:tetratricopeptide (TPR) repeat protein